MITVPPDTDVSEPTVVTVRGEDAAGAAFGHTVVEVGRHSRAVVVLDHAGSATYADNVEFVVGDGASLSVVSVQDWAADAVHLCQHQARVGRDATFQHTVVSLGGGVVRLAPSVSYAGPGGAAELLGLYFADPGQHLEHRLFVDHNQPHCRSRVDYKGALQGDSAHSVWIGDVLIRPEAIATDTYERNRNLLLTEGARADSVPNLEILTGEVVGAGHASTSGRLEDEHLFYLMARGIPLDEARRLVIRGFFGELIAKIEVAELRERITAAIENELAKLPGLQGRQRRIPGMSETSTFVRVCALADVPEQGAIGVEVGDLPIAIVRAEGEVFALRDECSHEEVPLSEGEVYDHTVECWLARLLLPRPPHRRPHRPPGHQASPDLPGQGRRRRSRALYVAVPAAPGF